MPILKVFLLGDSGDGKTTLRKALQRSISARFWFPEEYARDKPGDVASRTRGADAQAAQESRKSPSRMAASPALQCGGRGPMHDANN